MARINIEEELWTDPSNIALVLKLKCEKKAISNIILFWRLSQQQFKRGKLVSEDHFRIAELSEFLFETGWAIRTKDGIQNPYAEKHFGWLKSKKSAGQAGGRASALKKRELSEIKDLSQANPSTFNPLPLPLPLKKEDLVILQDSRSISKPSDSFVVVEKKTTPTIEENNPRNATQNFHALNSNPGFAKELRKFFEDAGIDSPQMKKSVGAAINTFGSKEKFEDWLSVLKKSPTFKKLQATEDRAGKGRYFQVAYLREIGLIEPSQGAK